ncbi:hypothetical protein BKA80DRAFT_272828 [Phyllosticta citrichinensis]
MRPLVPSYPLMCEPPKPLPRWTKTRPGEQSETAHFQASQPTDHPTSQSQQRRSISSSLSSNRTHNVHFPRARSSSSSSKTTHLQRAHSLNFDSSPAMFEDETLATEAPLPSSLLASPVASATVAGTPLLPPPSFQPSTVPPPLLYLLGWIQPVGWPVRRMLPKMPLH